jgi:cytoskeletal protein CcmA (bactofilin family)
MALWKDTSLKEPAPTMNDATSLSSGETMARTTSPDTTVSPAPFRRAAERSSPASGSESLIAGDVTIEGKIEGAGHVRIAGRFKGDINVQGNVTIEAGAHVTGQVYANTVIVSGELQGNIEASNKVELLESGQITGDVKAAVLTVAAGSRMRGQADFGWSEKGGSGR